MATSGQLAVRGGCERQRPQHGCRSRCRTLRLQSTSLCDPSRLLCASHASLQNPLPRNGARSSLRGAAKRACAAGSRAASGSAPISAALPAGGSGGGGQGARCRERRPGGRQPFWAQQIHRDGPGGCAAAGRVCGEARMVHADGAAQAASPPSPWGPSLRGALPLLRHMCRACLDANVTRVSLYTFRLILSG